MTDPRTTIGDGPRIAALWTGLLLAPVAFLANLEVGYALVPAACRLGTVLPIHAVQLACLLLALAGLGVANRNRLSSGSAARGQERWLARMRFMGALGVAVSLLFALTIVSQAIPTFVLSPCQ
jgi:hypothetical protein